MTAVRNDIDATFGVTQAISPQTITSATTFAGSAIDLSAKPGWKVGFWATLGTYTHGSFTPSLQQASASDGSFADLTPVSGSMAAITAGATTYKASYVPTKPFIRAAVLSASTATGAIMSAVVITVPPTA